MPPILSDPNYPQLQSSPVLGKDLGYSYPNDLDLRPSSDLHKNLVGMLFQSALESRRFIQDRETTWRKLERNLTAYVPLSQVEQNLKLRDPRKPVSIVVPLSFATLETLLTSLLSYCMRDPVFAYRGVDDQDVLGAALIETLVQMQVKRNKISLSLYYQLRDALVYGFGAVAPRWQVEYGLVPVTQVVQTLSDPFASILSDVKQNSLVEDIVFEGNVVDNIDPYLYLPDPNVPLSDPQKGEYVGWVQKTNYNALLAQEFENPEDFFNVKYLEGSDSRSSLFLDRTGSGRTPIDKSRTVSTYGRPTDVVWMSRTLIPAQHGLGSRRKPEKWLFGLAGDKVIVYAKPQQLEHGMYPVSCICPDADGHSLLATSRLEIVYGMQEFVDWSISSHITNVRKSLNDMWIVDPMLVNIQDLQDPEPGKLIRTRRSAWGRGVEGGIKQFPVVDVTSQHMQMLPTLADMINRIAGSTDILQGVMRTGGERRSALEAKDARTGALSRIEKIATISMLQGYNDLQRMLASHTQQFMTKDKSLRAIGRLAETLSFELGMPPGSSVLVTPDQLRIDWDYGEGTSSLTSPPDANLLAQALQAGTTNPEINSKVDSVRVYLQLLKAIGIADPLNYLRKGGILPSVNASVQPDTNVAAQAQAGNLLPLSEVSSVS